jgi:hypothetical protein
MPALVPDIAAALRPATVQTWSDPAVKARYPNARDGRGRPAEGNFDNPADGQTAVNQRGQLFGVERRRFAVEVAELVWPDPANGLPAARLLDPEHAVDAAHLSARIELDLETEASGYEVFG